MYNKFMPVFTASIDILTCMDQKYPSDLLAIQTFLPDQIYNYTLKCFTYCSRNRDGDFIENQNAPIFPKSKKNLVIVQGGLDFVLLEDLLTF